MSLSEELRDELAQIAPQRQCCRLAELSALFHVSGAWHLRGKVVAVHLDLASSAAARRAFALLRDVGVRSEIRTYHRHSFDRATRYQLHADVDEHALEVLREAGVLSPSGAPVEQPPRRVVGRSCCRGAYLRGALLGAGSLSGPRDPHLELRTATLHGAEFIVDAAAREDVALRAVERRTHAVAYAKGHEAIGDLLAIAGAGRTALALEEHAVVAGIRARANRLANADEANLVRTARAAHRQLEAIRALDAVALPAGLAEIAELRLRHPSASLRELAAKARPPLTKAAVQRRLGALVRLAESAESDLQVH
jgi:DNA-binding protein WhiA